MAEGQESVSVISLCPLLTVTRYTTHYTLRDVAGEWCGPRRLSSLVSLGMGFGYIVTALVSGGPAVSDILCMLSWWHYTSMGSQPAEKYRGSCIGCPTKDVPFSSWNIKSMHIVVNVKGITFTQKKSTIQCTMVIICYDITQMKLVSLTHQVGAVFYFIFF